MKYLFFFLMLVNIAFYLWETGAGRERSSFDTVEIKLPDDTERIVLIGELPAVPRRSPDPLAKGEAVLEQPSLVATTPARSRSTQASPSPTPRPPDPFCYRLGPYRSDGQARGAKDLLQEQVGEAEVVAGFAETPDGFWVLYPKAESVEAARFNRTMLMSKGIKELWVFDKGELAGAISLGLYQTREKAELAQKRYFAQNLNVEIVPRMNRSHALWVKLHWEGEPEELKDMIDRLPAARQNTAQPELKSCD